MDSKNQIILYQTEEGETRVEVLYESETVWLTQYQMAHLFQRDKSVISRHIKNILETGELIANSVVAKNATTATDGKSYDITYYNLDMIISVGYRVNSLRGTQFRIWATKTLREYIIKGFVMDDKRLENGGSNYFQELEERVRKIRASEKNFYKKVLEIFATSADYNPSSKQAQDFFATVQNKFHYAITGYTAAELIIQRVNSSEANMGLTNWNGKNMTLKDAFTAKNYLETIELKRLNLLVDQFLSYAELQIVEEKQMYMSDWIQKLDQFIRDLNEKPLLQGKGKKSRKNMEASVRENYEAYKERIMAEEALTSDLEWQRHLITASDNYTPPPEDDIKDGLVSKEEYDYLMRKMTSKSDQDQDDDQPKFH